MPQKVCRPTQLPRGDIAGALTAKPSIRHRRCVRSTLTCTTESMQQGRARVFRWPVEPLNSFHELGGDIRTTKGRKDLTAHATRKSRITAFSRRALGWAGTPPGTHGSKLRSTETRAATPPRLRGRGSTYFLTTYRPYRSSRKRTLANKKTGFH